MVNVVGSQLRVGVSDLAQLEKGNLKLNVEVKALSHLFRYKTFSRLGQFTSAKNRLIDFSVNRCLTFQVNRKTVKPHFRENDPSRFISEKSER